MCLSKQGHRQTCFDSKTMSLDIQQVIGLFFHEENERNKDKTCYVTARRSRFVHVELAKFISVPRAVIGSLGCKCVSVI